MRLNTTGIAARMMLSLDKKAIGEKLINGRQINPTPLQVRYPQGVREVLGIMSEQLAISTADLTRILLEDALHNMFMPADNTAGNIISRIEYIMLSHDINAPLLATLLSPWNIRSTVIQDPARLADYLSADALEHLAECFNLNPDWLNGHENYPIALSGEWPDTADNFRMLINDSSNTEVIFWHSFPFAGNTKREYYEKRKWLTEYTTRQNTTMSLRRVTLRPGLAGNLITGQILPVSLFNTSLLPW